MKKWIGSCFIVILMAWSASSFAVNRTIISVWDFDNISFMNIAESDYLTKALAEMLMTQLSTTSTLEVVERVHLREALEEQKIGSSELADEDTKLRLGKIFGARYMIFGSFMVIDVQARVDVRVVDAETSEVLLAEKYEGEITELMPGMQVITDNVIDHFGERTGQNLSGDLSHWKQYEAGLILIDEQQYETALNAFQAILEQTPDFSPAEKQIKLILDLMARQ